ncbi:hypothetical protein [Streptomyces sp. TRM70350]|uniref:hypothetical protein n=1 Tax=Streptomyces sp. TRM70350 TaxID=2856165 RepID=UPI0027DFDD0F|nr:hypothetical protein [Streptomyces sp. TRM70350]
MLLTRVDGIITPVAADHLRSGPRLAGRDGEGTSVSDRKAVRADVVGLVTPSREAPLTELDGRRVVVGAAPGTGAGGVIGAVLLVPRFVALSVLPFHVGGPLLLIPAAALSAADVLTPGVGVFAAGGMILLFRGDHHLGGRPQGLLGGEAVVRRVDGERGRVLLDGAWSAARGRTAPVTEEQHVRLVDLDGLGLIVESAEAAHGGPHRAPEDGS